MAITDTVIPYEILIRLNEDGTFRGAHQQRLRIVKDGDTSLAETLLPAEPLDLVALGADGILAAPTEKAAAAATALNDMTAQLQRATDQIADLSAALALSNAERDEALRQLAAGQAAQMTVDAASEG